MGAKRNWLVPVFRRDTRHHKRGELPEWNKSSTYVWGFDPADVDLVPADRWHMDAELALVEVYSRDSHWNDSYGRRFRMPTRQLASLVQNDAVILDGRVSGRWVATNNGGKLGIRYAGPAASSSQVATLATPTGSAPAITNAPPPGQLEMLVKLPYNEDFVRDADPNILLQLMIGDAQKVVRNAFWTWYQKEARR